MAYYVDAVFNLVSDDNNKGSHLLSMIIWFWVRKVIYIFVMLIRLRCPRFASEKCVPEKCHVPNVTQLPSSGPGA